MLTTLSCDLLILSRVTSPPPLSPWQMSPIRELAHRLTGNILGAGHLGVRRYSRVSLHSFRFKNLLNIVSKSFMKTNFLLELNFLQCCRKTVGVGYSFSVVTGGVSVDNSVQTPPHNCAIPLCWQVQAEVILVSQTQRPST